MIGWDIDEARFAGKPRITTHDGGANASITLRGGRFPGTTLSADFDAKIEQVEGSWRIDIAFAGPAATVHADLLPWLMRASTATGFARTGAGLTFVNADRGAVSLERDAHLSFTTDGVLRFKTRNGVLLRLDADQYYGHEIAISPTADAASLLGATDAQRTWLSVRRDPSWPVVPGLSGSGWSVETSAEALPLACIECVEDAGGTDAAVQFRGTDGAATLRIGPQSAAIALRNIRYSVPLNARRRRGFFVADFPETPSWLSLGTSSICLGHCEGGQPLHILVEDQEARAIRATPGVFGVSLPQSPDGPQLAPLQTQGEPLTLVPENKAGLWKRLTCWLRLSNCDELCLPIRQGSTELIRADDQLRLGLELRGVDLETKDGRCVVTPSKATPGNARLLVHFPPQHLFEEAFYEQSKVCGGADAKPGQHGNSKPEPPRSLYAPPVASLISGPSRLVFKLDSKIDYTAKALLSWTPLALQVSTRATRPGQRPSKGNRLPVPLTDDETQLEIPTRLMLSPDDSAVWVGSEHRRVNDDRRFELWHARLGTKLRDDNGSLKGVAAGGPLRAMWTPGYDPNCLPGHDFLPFASTLNHRDRVEFVALTSNFELGAKGVCPGDQVPDDLLYMPEPIGADHLMLSSMGGWLKSRGTWDPPMTASRQALTVEQWEHRAVMARDQFVKVVYRGFLVPLGVRCVLVKTSERKIQDIPGHDRNPVAVLRFRYEIIVREAEKLYPALAQKFEARGWGFRAVHFQGGFTTPSLDWPRENDPSMFFPYVGCEPFLFPFELETLDGERLPCRAPLLFIDNTVAYGECADVLVPPGTETCPGESADGCPSSTANPTDFRAYYNKAPDPMRTWLLHDGKVTYAASKTPGETRFETKQIVVRADAPDWNTKTDIAGCSFHPGESPEAKKARLCLTLFKENRAPVFPFVSQAEVRIAAVEQLTGKFEYFTIEPDDTYICHGFSPNVNAGEVFARITSRHTLQFTGAGAAHGDKAGAIASPNTSLVGVSRKLGPVGGSPQNIAQSLAAVSTGEFRPADYFGSQIESAKLLGGIRLVDILAAVAPLSEAPEALRRVVGLQLEPFRKAVTTLLDAVSKLLLPVQFFEHRVKGDYDTARQLLAELPTPPAGEGSSGIGGVIGIVVKQAAIVERLRRIAATVDDAVHHPQAVAEEEMAPWAAQLTKRLERLKVDAQAIRDLVLLTSQHALMVEICAFKESLTKKFGDAAAAFLTEAITRTEAAIGQFVSSGEASAMLESASKMLAAADDLRSQARRLTDALAVPAAREQLIRDAVREFVRTDAEATATTAISVVFQTARGELEPLAQQAIAAVPADRQAEARRTYAALLVAHRRIEELPGRLQGIASEKMLTALHDSFRLQADLVTALADLHDVLTLAGPSGGAALAGAETWLRRFTSHTRVTPASVNAIKNVLLASANVGDHLTRLRIRADKLGDRLTAATAGVPAEWANARKIKERLEVGSEYITLFADVLTALGLPSADLIDAAGKLKEFSDRVEEGWNKVKALETELRAAVDQAPPILRARATRMLEEAFAPLRAQLTEAERKVQESAYALVATLLANLRRMQDHLLSLLRPTLNDIAQVLGIKERIERELADLLKPIDIELSYRWSPKIHEFGDIFDPHKLEGGFSLISTVSIPINPAAALTGDTPVGTPRMSLHGELLDFTLHLLNKNAAYFIAVDFEHAKFSSRTGSAPTCDVKISEIRFKGCLEFIEDLRHWLKGKEGVFLDLRADQVITGFRFTLPVIPLAAMLLQNVRLEAAFLLRFNGDPFRILLGVSSKRSPAELVAGPYGGTFYVQMVLGPDGIESFAMGMAFGLVGRISIGLAEGSGRLVAGIAIDRTSAGVELSGFVETAAQVSLIGLSVSVYGYLGLHYADHGRCHGEVLIEITIELFMCEVSFSFHVVKEFGGEPAQTRLAPVAHSPDAARLPMAPWAASSDEVLNLDWTRFNAAFEEAYGS